MEKKDAFRSIPKMDAILGMDEITCLPLRQEIIKKAAEEELDMLRDSIRKGEIGKSPSAKEIAARLAASLTELMGSGIRPMINATGVMVYTNLGRAPLSTFALMAMLDAGAYSDLEYNVKEGSRGSRQDHIREIARKVFGVEDAIAVNNNAAAVMLVLASLAAGREVIVSRGELVEIGGSFRMPDVMALSGARLKEVGTTNKTRLSDYEAAINGNTGLIMKVHRSNFALIGFTDEVPIRDLSALAHTRGIPFYVDMGSGIPFDLGPFGIHGEWTVPSCLSDGADIVSFSGDKVLSGPQAGVIIGRKSLISGMSKHPLHRAVRIDKFSLAALAETLKLLGMEMYDELPVLRMITEESSEVRKRALKLRRRLKTGCTVTGTKAVIGGGAAPSSSIPSFAVVVSVSDSVAAHARLRREGIVCRIEGDRLIFDMKTVSEEELKDAAERINNAL
jgi:L-seryl-tRNA(Ser) seleniumtransferase